MVLSTCPNYIQSGVSGNPEKEAIGLVALGSRMKTRSGCKTEQVSTFARIEEKWTLPPSRATDAGS